MTQHYTGIVEKAIFTNRRNKNSCGRKTSVLEIVKEQIKSRPALMI
jgi:hypothetical protein